MYPRRGLLTTAADTVIAQLKGITLGRFTFAHILAGMTHSNFLKGTKTGGTCVMGARIDGAFDAWVTVFVLIHKKALLYRFVLEQA